MGPSDNNKHNNRLTKGELKTAIIYIEFVIIFILVIILVVFTVHQNTLLKRTLSDMSSQQKDFTDELLRLTDSVNKMEKLQESLVSHEISETILTYDDEGNEVHIPLLADVPRHSYDWTCLQVKDGFKNYIVDNQVVSYRGIDVSNFQGEIDWQQVKNAGVDFAMIRLGYRGYGTGVIELDERFEANIQGATAAGIDVGVYFFSQAISEEEAIEEANFVLQNIKNYNITYPIAYDMEPIPDDTARTDYLTGRQITDHCIAFSETIKNAGYIPMIYSNKRQFILKLDLSSLADYDTWYAGYISQPDYPYDFKIWQYTDKGQVPGIEGNVDLNISFVDYPTLKGQTQ